MAATLSTKGQVTIPKEIREALNIRCGDMVDFVMEKGKVSLRGIKKGQAHAIASSLNKYAKPSLSGEERDITKGEVARDAAQEDTLD